MLEKQIYKCLAKLLLVALIYFLPTYSWGQSFPSSSNYNAYQFKHLSEKDGLPHKTLHAAIMDKEGFIWFGTQDGLSKWDGKTIKNFFPIEGDSTSLSGSLITAMDADEAGYIWIVSHQGDLCRLDPIKETFKTFPYPEFESGLVISSEMAVHVDDNGIIWIGCFDDGLIRFDPKENTFQQFNLIEGLTTDEELVRLNSVLGIQEDIENPNILWLGSNSGLHRFNKRTKKMENFLSTEASTERAAITSLWMEKEGELWMATYGVGIVRFDIETQKWNYFIADKENWKNPYSNVFYGLSKKSVNEFWVSSVDQGSGILNTQTGVYTFFRNSSEDITSISSNKGFKAFTDDQKRVWFLNGVNGLSYADPSCQLFQYTDLSKPTDLNLDRFAIDLSFDERRKKLYTVGHLEDGLIEIDLNNGTHQRIPLAGFEGQLFFGNAVLHTSNDMVLVGVRASIIGADSKASSLFKYDRKDKKLKTFRYDELSILHGKNIRDLQEDQQQQLWIATDDGLLLKYNFSNQKIESYSLSTLLGEEKVVGINQIVFDDERQQLLLATFNGVYSFDKKTEQFKVLKGTADYSSRGIAKSKSDLLWIGTRQFGLQCFDLKKNTIIKLEGYRDVPRTPIEKVIIDNKDRPWVTSEKGIYLLNQEQKRYFNFTAKDGLNKDYFFLLGATVLPNGQIILGQRGGIYQYHPDELDAAIDAGQVILTDFRVNEELYPTEQNSEGNLSCELSYLENSINFSYSCLSYCQQDKIKFVYQLEGQDDDWIVPFDNRNRANYTSLAPGSYTFKVKKIEDADDQATLMNVIIRSPWWRTWWAYSIYAFLTIFGGYTFFNARNNRQREKEESERIKELDSFKTRFYTNITHEFRTPLTIINGMAEKIKEQPEEWNESGVEMIKRNSNNLLSLINQLLDLQKLESGKLSPNLIQGEVIAYLKYITESFHSYASQKEIQIHFLSRTDSLWMDYDPDRLLNIVSNLLSNAIKFTDSKGDIYLQLNTISEEENELLEIIIKDTGIGITAEKLPHIFDRFYQVDESDTRINEGSGIGLALTKELTQLLKGNIEVESTPNVGTSFRLLFPVTRNAKKEQALPNENIASPIHNLNASLTTPSPKAKTKEDIPIVLVIEDNIDVQHYLNACLKDHYFIHFADDGAIGIQKAIAEVPDIIISDVMMPKKNGFEVCQTLKQYDATSHIPIIILTARASIEDKIEGLTYGADAYLAKPFNPKELLVRVEKLIEGRQQLQAKYSQGKLITTLAPKQEDAYLKKVQEVILEHLEAEQFGPTELAEVMNISRTQLHRKMKALTNSSTSKYINKIRLEKAKTLLSTTEMSVSEIAYAVGFTTLTYFSNNFSKAFNISPSDFRQQQH